MAASVAERARQVCPILATYVTIYGHEEASFEVKDEMEVEYANEGNQGATIQPNFFQKVP
jgi:hypothetical protein